MPKSRPIIPMSLTMILLVAACTSSGTADTSAPAVDGATFATDEPPEQTSKPTNTSPLGTTQTTETTQTGIGVSVDEATTTTQTPSESKQYAVIAEERSGRLAVIDATATCSGNVACDVDPVLRIDLTEGPHNLVGVGSVVYATHPSAGSVSRIDIAIEAVSNASVGSEPHDVAYDPYSETLYVADEEGRRLLSLDPNTLSVIDEVELPARPHVLAVADDAVWITLVGRDELARVAEGDVDLFSTGGSPHSLIVDRDGLIWFSNWNSEVLNLFDPSTGTTVRAPSGATQPHHFAVGQDGVVWVSDNAGGAVIGFGPEAVTTSVGSTPHHLSFVETTLVVAVSGTGQAVMVRNGEVAARSQLTEGLHGVAVVAIP